MPKNPALISQIRAGFSFSKILVIWALSFIMKLWSCLYSAFGWEIVGVGEDPNPLRYCGEYWDEETQTYYLRARYYDPVYGRFTQQDQVPYISRELPNGETAIDPLSLNLYTYCANNPITYCDPSGNAWDIVFDVVSAGMSLKEYAADPTLKNAAFFLWDVGSAFIPLVPGSYVIKGAKYVVRAENAVDLAKIVDKFSDATDWIKILSETANSKVLRDNMTAIGKLAPDYKHAAHHIVAGRAEGAFEARSILWKYGISVNDAVNGVFLPTVKSASDATYHPGLHTVEYYSQVNKMLNSAKSKEDVIGILNDIATQLITGTFKYK